MAAILDFGDQPPSNRFLPAHAQSIESHPLRLGCCELCGLVQLVFPMPPNMVRSRYEWVRYNEPEGHLDRMTGDLIAECGIGADARILGLTYKDDSILARFKQRGFSNTYRLDTVLDLEMEDQFAGLESVQSSVTTERTARLAQVHGQADLVLVRHVLEHAHAPLSFLDALSKLLKPTGSLVFEVPGCTKFLGACDYSFVWEEHTAYFTPGTLSAMMRHANLHPWIMRSYQYPLEDSLVVVAGRTVSGGATECNAPEPESALAAEVERARLFGSRFGETRERLRAALSRLKLQGKRVAVLGAGHLAVKYLNFFGLQDLVDCVIDDDPNKLGMRLPGSGLPIRASSALIDERIDLCLLSLSPESEKRVLGNNDKYMSMGGRFRSIFALSPITLEGVSE